MHSIRSIWWLNPINIYIVITLVAVYAFSISEQSYWSLYQVQGKYVDLPFLGIYLISAFLFCYGCYTAKDNYGTNINKAIFLENTCDVLFKITMLAYVIWFSRFIMLNGLSSLFSFVNPSVLSEKNVAFIRQSSGRIPGLTTMTEFGVIVAPLSVVLYRLTYNAKYKKMFFILCFIACIRSALFSERLALMEILVPSFIVFAAFRNYNILYTFFPLCAVFFLLIAFGVFEYSRSWKAYYMNVYEGTYVKFVIDRVLGYYTIAVNTECTRLHFYDAPFFPTLTFQWLWKFPLLDKIPSFFNSTSNVHVGENMLELYGNPEFNNPGGMLIFVQDFSFLGLPLSFIFGRIVGILYKAFKRGFLEGVLLYPICVLCLIELPRYFYFGNNRACFVLIGMIVVYKKINRIV